MVIGVIYHRIQYNLFSELAFGISEVNFPKHAGKLVLHHNANPSNSIRIANGAGMGNSGQRLFPYFG